MKGIKKVDKVHSGQYGRYGDRYDKWSIELEEDANLSDEELTKYCFDNLSKSEEQTYEQWSHANGDAGIHFKGYYRLYKTNNIITYEVVKPYCD